jgi:hypothetical protein
MANVFLIGLDRPIVDQISRVVEIERHTVREGPYSITMRELEECGVVFAGGDSLLCLSLLRRVRQQMPRLPFVVVAKSAGTGAWLDALGAGATDYCCLPLERRQIQRLMEPVISLGGGLSNFALSAGYSTKRWIRATG